MDNENRNIWGFPEQSGNFGATVAGLSEKELVAVVGTLLQ
jgi:hypothetical protein